MEITEHDLSGPHPGDYVFCDRCRRFHEKDIPWLERERRITNDMANEIAAAIDAEILEELLQRNNRND